MTDFYDALETREPAAREREQAAALRGIVARAMGAPGWARHLEGVAVEGVSSDGLAGSVSVALP